MFQSSFSVGRFLGVDLRIHWSFPALLALSVGYSIVVTGSALRGIGLWLALLFAVLVRETARAIAAAYSGMRLRALFLLPMGGVMALAPREHGANSPPRAVTLAAPIANFGMGLLLFALCYSIDPKVPLLAQPWISMGHILRSVLWIQVLMGALDLLPAATLSSRRLLRARPGNNAATQSASDAATGTAPAMGTGANTGVTAKSALGLGAILALALILIGLLGMKYWPMNLWPIVIGGFLLLGSRLQAAQGLDATAGDAILVRDVMLTEFTLLSSSDTLQGALNRTVHSLQDVFPVVRGDRLVGSVSRQTIANRLQSEGDSYLQGAMTRNLQLASPEEKLVMALRRAGSQGASEFIPVVEDGAMLGILTPQSLSRAVQAVKVSRPRGEAQARP